MISRAERYCVLGQVVDTMNNVYNVMVRGNLSSGLNQRF